jgi:uncharacterized protein DUF4416
VNGGKIEIKLESLVTGQGDLPCALAGKPAGRRHAMGVIRDPIPAKLFAGMLSPESALLDDCVGLLCAAYGPLDYESDVMPWNTTDYYRDEMGTAIYRKFIFFKELVDPGALAAVKNFTNGIEERYSLRMPSGIRRRINLDPGYITEAKVVLASTKDFSHRVYIGENIYAEVTLRYSSKERSFTACDHTYFDFRTEAYRLLFNRARDLLREGLKQIRE